MRVGVAEDDTREARIWQAEYQTDSRQSRGKRDKAVGLRIGIQNWHQYSQKSIWGACGTPSFTAASTCMCALGGLARCWSWEQRPPQPWGNGWAPNPGEIGLCVPPLSPETGAAGLRPGELCSPSSSGDKLVRTHARAGRSRRGLAVGVPESSSASFRLLQRERWGSAGGQRALLYRRLTSHGLQAFEERRVGINHRGWP